MNREEAISIAEDAAKAGGFGWSEVVFADRFRIWPWQPFWRITARIAGENEFFTGQTLAIIRERTGETSVRRIRPWSDYSLERMVLCILGFTVLNSCLVLGALRLLGLFFESVREPVVHSVAVGGANALPLFLLPFLRILGRDAWLLRRDLRKAGARGAG